MLPITRTTLTRRRGIQTGWPAQFAIPLPTLVARSTRSNINNEVFMFKQNFNSVYFFFTYLFVSFLFVLVFNCLASHLEGELGCWPVGIHKPSGTLARGLTLHLGDQQPSSLLSGDWKTKNWKSEKFWFFTFQLRVRTMYLSIFAKSNIVHRTYA